MGYTILLVDDSETIRMALERAIGMTDLVVDEIVQAANGREALEKLGEKWVDIVFTDINMPEMNGIVLVEEIKKNPEYAQLPVVVVSTEGSSQRIEELTQKGIAGYLRKPFTPERIRDMVLLTLGGWNNES